MCSALQHHNKGSGDHASHKTDVHGTYQVCCDIFEIVVQHNYRSIRAKILLKLKASLGSSYARFEAMDKSSFVLGNELWEEHFESLLALVKEYIIDIWEERKSNPVMLSVLNNPVLTLQLGILGKLLGLMGRIVKGCVREVSLAQVSCILMLLRPHQWVRGRWPWGYGSVMSIIYINRSMILWSIQNKVQEYL